MKRIAVLIFAVVSMILFMSCDGSENFKSDKIIIYTETSTTQTETSIVAGTFEIDYIVNTNTRKFHYTSCPSVNQMKEHNKWEYTGSRDDLILQGYEPFKRCEP